MLQGERDMAIDNKTIGRFQLDGIPPAPRGMPQIEVSFDIDANGIMNVSAKDKATNKEQSIKIESSSGLSRDEIDRMVADAESHKDEDQEKRESVETRNNAEQMAYMTEKQLEEQKDTLSAETGAEVAQALADLQEALKGESIERIKTESDKLEKVWHKAAQEMYEQAEQAGAAQETGAAGEGAQPDGEATGQTEEAVEADFEVVEDDSADGGEK